ncbi:MAG: hypothetical protein QMD10_12490 [Desulfitobacteriaceae bacterium]|nr:hypothetical protein [Desulfitobacteriaceae bacterium]
MGATTFWVTETGFTPKEAFKKAVDKARYMYGHGGYTGTIAEKDSFVMINVPQGKNPEKYAQELLNSEHEVADKWGPAGCILLEQTDIVVDRELPPEKVNIEKHSHKGPRKWKTVYALYSKSNSQPAVLIGQFDDRTVAIDEAKKFALRHPGRCYEVRIEKVADGHDQVLCEIKAVRKTVKEKVKINRYLFFGWAKC